MTKDSLVTLIFSRLNARRTRAIAPQSRVARIERLETRELLAVTVAEYGQLRAEYAEFALPESPSDLNIIEIPADSLSRASLVDALETAGSTRTPDLVLVRTTSDSHTIDCSSAELKYELDESFFGATTLVAVGDAPLTLSGGGSNRALAVALGRLNLGAVTLAGGSTSDSGGGLFNSGSVVLKNSSIVSSAASAHGGAVYTVGELTAVNTEIADARGVEAIYATGAVSLTNCSISGASGVGLYVGVGGVATVAASTFSGNEVGLEIYLGELSGTNLSISSNRSGGLINSGAVNLIGGVVSDNAGVGLRNQSVVSDAKFPATFTAERVVFSGNASSHGSGLYNFGGVAELTSCAFFGNTSSSNGGAIYNAYVADLTNKTTLVNCTVAGNVSGAVGGGVYSESGFGLSLYNTLIAQNAAVDVAMNLSGASTQKNSIIGGNPEFVVGPIFDVHTGALTNGDSLDLRLTRNSVGTNKGDSAWVADGALDLAGASRLHGRVDVGAYEYQGVGYDTPSRSLTVTTLEDSFDLTDGRTSLREALYFANDGSDVTFAENLSGVLQLNSQLVATTATGIAGGGRITLDGRDRSRVLVGESALTLTGLTISNGYSAGVGGSVYASGDLTLTGVTFSGGSSSGHGAQVYALGKFEATDSRFSNGRGLSSLYVRGDASARDGVYIVGGSGIGLYISSGSAELSQVEISGNGGVGLVNYLGALTIADSSINSNGGTGLHNIGVATLDRVEFLGNAGGVVNESAELPDGTKFTSNLTGANLVVRGNRSEFGGGVLNRSGRVTLTNAELSGNISSADGGGIYNELGAGYSGSVSLTNCTVAGNVAHGRGGGIASPSSNATLLIYDTIVSQNYASNVDSNISGDVSAFYGSYADGSPGFIVAPRFDYKTGALLNLDDLNLRLAANSVAIDVGSATESAATYDLDGAARVYGARVDAGAYEYHGGGSYAPSVGLVVTTLADVVDPDDGFVSLREALYSLNGASSTITFAPELEGVVSLVSQLVVSSPVTLDGNDRITLDGQSLGRVALVEAPTRFVNITLANGATSHDGGLVYARSSVEFEGASARSGSCGSDGNGSLVYALDAFVARDATFTGGQNAAAIRAAGSLTLENVRVLENVGAGISASGESNIVKSTISSNGGYGLRNEHGAATLKEVAITSNVGTGLINLGQVTLTSCVISENVESGIVNGQDDSRSYSGLKFYGGVIKGNLSAEFGGGLLNLGGSAELYNVDISGNVAPRGAGVYNAYRAGGYNTTSLVNCTVAGNSAQDAGGGVYSDASEFSVAIYNSIIAKNFAKTGIANVSGGTLDARNSLTSGAPGFQQDPLFDGQGALTNPDAYSLQLQRSSVCVDAGDNTLSKGLTDASGAPRISNTTIDLGAYEYYPEHSTVVTTLEDSFDLNDAELSLREALYLARPGDVVSFQDTLRGELVVTSPLVVSGRVTIFGAPDVVVSGRYATQLIQNSGELTLENLTLANGKTSDSGGAIYNTGALTLKGSTVRNSESPLGGAIYNGDGATLTVTDSKLLANYADSFGGAIYNAGELTIVSSQITDNRANESGGALYSAGATTLVNSLIAHNSATTSGGAIHSSGYFYSTNATIASNESLEGGGVYAPSGSLRFYNTILATNVASSGADFVKGDASVAASHTVSSYTFANGSNNVEYLSGTPLFLDASSRDYRLADDSIALDFGSDLLALQSGLAQYSADLSGGRRILGAAIDAGAYERALERADVVYAPVDATFTLEMAAESGQRVYWDLSGTGAGNYAEGNATLITSASELNFRPGEYAIFGKTVSESGATVSSKRFYVQILDVPPSVRVERAPFSAPGVAVFTIDATFSGSSAGHTWRVDWGDGTSSAFTSDVFTTGKVYAPTVVATNYDVTLTLLNANRYAECVFYLASVGSPTSTSSGAVLETPVADAFADFECEDSLVSAVVDELAESLARSSADADARAQFFATESSADEYDVVGIESFSFGKKKRSLGLR